MLQDIPIPTWQPQINSLSKSQTDTIGNAKSLPAITTLDCYHAATMLSSTQSHWCAVLAQCFFFLGIITTNPPEVWPIWALPTLDLKLITLPPCTSIRYPPPPRLPTWPLDIRKTPFYSKLEHNTDQTMKIHSLFVMSPRNGKILVTSAIDIVLQV